jgi:hypothetical protein
VGDFTSIADQLAALSALDQQPSSPNVVLPTFNVTDIQPPANVYVTTDDTLVIGGWNAAPNQTLIVSVRFLLSTGPTVQGQYSFTLPSNRSAFAFYIPLTNGYMLSVTLALQGGSSTFAQRGYCYCSVNIARAGTVFGIPSFVLFSDYVSADLSISWPSWTQNASVSGMGAGRSIILTTPAAGSNLSETVPTNCRWRLRYLSFNLTTSSAVATRQVVVTLLSPSSTVFYAYTPIVTQAASLSYNYIFSTGFGFQSSALQGTGVYGSLGEIVANQSWSFGTSVTNLQSGDQIQNPYCRVEEWIDPSSSM